MTASKKQRKSGRVAAHKPANSSSSLPSATGHVDLYSALSEPVACCEAKDHKKRKNCVNNPWCLIDLHDEKKGIWKAMPASILKLGNDPSLIRRNLQSNSLKLTPGGLKNLGATCYLNVLIQMLFHNLLIRDAIFNMQLHANNTVAPVVLEDNKSRITTIDDKRVEENTLENAHMNMVVGALQDAFGHLDLCLKGDHDISLFVDLLELNKSEQQDPQEFSKLFFAKLDESKLPLRDDNLPAIKQLISGKETYSTTCSICNNISSQSNEYHEIGLNIDGCNELQDAINGYEAVETLSGENQFSCSACNKKTDATRGVKITETPDLLIFKLMRYYYDRRTNEKKKSQVIIFYMELLYLLLYLNYIDSSTILDVCYVKMQ